MVAAAATLTGCSSGPTTTRLTQEDLSAMTAGMAADLRAGLFSGRAPDSPPMRIAIHRVRNLSTDIIPADEQWAIMARVRDAQPIVELARERNVTFVIPAEYLAGSRLRGEEPGFGAGRDPTHLMDATIHAARRARGGHRTDLYSCRFRITDVDTGDVVWMGLFDFKRAAKGRSYD